MSLRKLLQRKPKCPHGEDDTQACPRCLMEVCEDDEMQFMPLHEDDLQACVEALPPNVSQTIKWHANKLVLAGGYIRSHVAHLTVHDIDWFVTDNPTGVRVVDDFCRHTHESNKCWDFGICSGSPLIPVQLLYRWPFKTPTGLLRQFDFSISQAALWFDSDPENPGWRGTCSINFYPDLAAKRLRMVPGKFDGNAGSMLYRLLRFAQEGFYAPESCLAAVFAMCAAIAMPDKVEQAEMEAAMLRHLMDMPKKRQFDWGQANQPEKRPEPPRRSEYGMSGGS